MGHVPLSWYLVLSAILFALGVAGFVYRKSIITVFMSIELMLNGVNLSFVAFSYELHRIDGQIFSFFVMVVAAAEAAVGLAIIVTIFKNRGTLQIDEAVGATKHEPLAHSTLSPDRVYLERPLGPPLSQGAHQFNQRRNRSGVL